MSLHSLIDSNENQVMLRIQYQCKLKDDAITKATKLIEQLQEQINLLKEDKQNLKKDNAKKSLEIDNLQNKHRELEYKITFLQDCINEKDKQIFQLYEGITIQKERQEKKFNKYLTISYESVDRHRSQKKEKLHKNMSTEYFNSIQAVNSPTTPMRSTKKKYAINKSFNQEPMKLSSISQEMIDLKKNIQTKDKHNVYLLKKNKAIQDYLSVLQQVNHPILRRQTPKIHRGYLI